MMQEPLGGLWGPMMDPFRVVRRILGSDPFAGLTAPTSLVFAPDIEIKETQQGYVIQADLPGVRDKDLEVSVIGNRLTISGKREEETRHEEDRYFACERCYGAFSRSFVLPEGANLDKLDAELDSGVLRVTVPKRAEMQPRKIEITGKQGRRQIEGGKPAEAPGRAEPQKKAA